MLTPNPQQQTAQAPIPVIDTGNRTRTLTITEPQLNAALERLYTLAPLERYSAPPYITLSDGSIIVESSIAPQNAPDNGQSQTITLLGTLQVFDGKLEFAPVELEPQNVGVTTLQVKHAHRLLLRTINELVASTVSANLDFFAVNVELGELTITVSLR